MPWEIRKELHLDVNAGYGSVLMVSATDSSLRNPAPDVVAGDRMPVRLFFWERGPNGTLIAANPGSAATIIFTGRPDGVPAGSNLLFETNDFAEVSEGVWEGTLDFSPVEFSNHLVANPPGAKLITGEVEIRDATGLVKRLSLQFDLKARPQVYENQDAPDSLPDAEEWIAARALLITPGQVLTLPEKANALSALGLPGVNTFDATGPPTVADDSTLGYSVGSLWIDVVGNEAYRCIDATEGAAEWIETTLDAAEVAGLIAAAIAALGLGTASTSDVEDFAPAQTFQTVTNNNAKLSLPLDTPVGKLFRITAEANRKERYLGDVSGDAVCAVTIDGDVHFLAGASGGKPTYLSPYSGHGASYDGGRWVQSAGVAALGNEDYPWLADWSGMPSGPPGEVGSVVEKNPVAADENWEVVGDSTYELFVFHTRGGGGALTVNGVVLPQFINTNVGWVKAGSVVPKISASGYLESLISVVRIDNIPAGGTLGGYFGNQGITTPIVGKRVTRVDIAITSAEAG